MRDLSALTDAQLAAERAWLRGLPRGKRKPDKLREIGGGVMRGAPVKAADEASYG